MEHIAAAEDCIRGSVENGVMKAPAVPGRDIAAIDHFVESRAVTETFLKTTTGLRDHAADSPNGQKWDAYEFILLIAAHSERHTNQIKEVKADPNYPKS